jgi:uncharacterized protein (DUF305 family)
MFKLSALVILTTLSLATTLYAAEMPSSSMMAMPSNNQSSVKMQECMKMMNTDMKMSQDMTNKMMLKELGQQDANYDARFIDLMIPHHEAAIMMAKDALQKTNRPEVKQMAQNIITAQEKEIAQLKQWRKDWYGN